jgi:serine-type D-Ala-D-Ala carboxypeptidase (penicillin-binding protein 5/6)
MPKAKRKNAGFFLIIFLAIFNLLWLLTNLSVHLFSKNPISEIAQNQNVYSHPLQPIAKSSSSPNVLAPAYLLIDADTNTILISKNPENRIFPASVTKLATAITALNIYPLDEVVTITEEYKEGKVMELKPGEKITVKSLVTALLVYSANDAAFNLASHHQQGVQGFIKEMNLLAQKYHLANTNFTNFDGIHDPNHYSTVYDLAQLARLAIKNPIIKEYVKYKNLTVTDVDRLFTHDLISTNELLGVIPEIEGLKTGYTIEAGGCFVGLINLNGHYLISVVAQSPDRFADTKSLVAWAKYNLSWQPYTL